MRSSGDVIRRWCATPLLPLFAAIGTALLLAQSPTVALSAAAVAFLMAASARGAVHSVVVVFPSSAAISSEVRRLRGAFRRQSAADAPGRPRKPRAPGVSLAAA